MEQEVRALEQDAELKRFCALQAREDRLAERMRQLECRLAGLEDQMESSCERRRHRDHGDKQTAVASLGRWSDASS